jgi:hypothetical protein
MRLRYVTITGADDAVSYNDLWSLHQQYPFVEWAILFSQTKSGVARYPTWEWVMGLMEFVKKHRMNLASHLCEKWVIEVLNGNCTFFESKEVRRFKRVQLNLGTDKLKKAVKSTQFIQAISTIRKPVLMGGNYGGIDVDYWLFVDNGMYPMFDASGGKGVVSNDWHKPIDLLCGYAGGLSPDNILAQLKSLGQVVGDAEIWVDMESGVRTDDKLDLDKVRQVLDVAKTWVPEL